MNFEDELMSARQRIDLYRSRYIGKDDSYDPIRIAIQWCKLFESPKANVDEARKLVASVVDKKNGFDINFFTFCNHMEKTLKQMIKDSLIE